MTGGVTDRCRRDATVPGAAEVERAMAAPTRR
ncbi:MAG: hypothetical protein QOD63_3130 [Actinomycetota bacterium]|nr:hypothetical protein [Actinomycetota bacterium]